MGKSQKSRAWFVEQAWVWSVVGYTVVRFFIAWGAFGDYGASPWIFGLLDVGTAWPYAKAVAAVNKRAAAFDWRGMAKPAAIAFVLFMAPYVYLWFAADSMPSSLRVGLAIVVTVLFLSAVAGAGFSARRLRRARAAEHETEETEVLIDLTGDEPVVTELWLANAS